MYLLKKHLFKITITIIIFTLLMGCENGKNPTSPNIKVYNAFGNEPYAPAVQSPLFSHSHISWKCILK